jgi:PAS domain S-box-containing protein
MEDQDKTKKQFINEVDKRTAELLKTNEQLRREIEERKRTQEALGEQKDFLNTLLETISNPVFYKDEHGRYIGCNKAFESFTGRSRADIVGKTVYDMGPKEIADKYYEKDLELFEKPGKQRYEWKIKSSDGVLRDVIFDKATLKNASGHTVGLVGVISDITERKRSEETLREREETLKAILAASPIGIFLARNRILGWTNPAMYRIWGYKMDSLLGQSTRSLYSSVEEYERVGRDFYTAIEKNNVGKIETQWITKSGKKVHCYLQGCRLDPADPSKGIIVAAMDITERKHAEDLVRNLSQLLLNAQENERQMISYELHDSIAQSLSSLKIDCDTFFDNQPMISHELKEKMTKKSELIGQVIRAVRDLSYGLHPPSLNQMGIIQTISQLCGDFSEKTGLGVKFTPTGMSGLKPNQTLGINLYRLVQEGLNNVRKHADADHVSVNLLASHPNIILRIEDNGKGFDVKAREAALNGEKKMGLRSMAERVGLLQGRMKIKSAPLQGTKIIIKIPFMKEKGNDGSKNTHHHN